MKKYPISAIVVVFDEERYLEQCLSKLGFCDELAVIDIGSNDTLYESAQQYATRVIRHKRENLETIHGKFVPELKNKIVLLTDPDEIIPRELMAELEGYIYNADLFTRINVPIQYYYKGKKLSGTVWGGKNYRRFLINKEKVKFVPRIHRGLVYLEKQPKIIRHESSYPIKHFWADSFQELRQRHLRYLKEEGNTRFSCDERYTLFKKVKESMSALNYSLVTKRSLLYGWREIFLSFFYAWYVWQANNALRDYERDQR